MQLQVKRVRRRTRSDTDLASRLAVSARHRPSDTSLLEAWLAERRRRNPFAAVRTPLDRLTGWSIAPDTSDLVHESGRFFSVQGIHVRTDYAGGGEWWQPILDQPERAILGIVAKSIDGVLHFLMQAKMEPGNANTVQVSPTVQATPSNYLRAHRGGHSRYLEYFLEHGRGQVLVDVLQSEQGSWFRGKRNRNMVVEVAGDVEQHDDFIWLTLGDLYALLERPNVVNMDSRTVLSCLPLPVDVPRDDDLLAALWHSANATDDDALSTVLDIGSWLTERKASYQLDVRQVPLGSVVGWERDRMEIRHSTGRYFSIVGVEVEATNREVRRWCQPLLAPHGVGVVAFVVRRIDGVLHVLARADVRPGYRDVVELGPTVQCTPANFDRDRRPELLEVVLSAAARVHYDVLQSEEGGRFHYAVTRHLLVEVGDDFPLSVSPDHRWVTLSQLKGLIRSSYQVNIEARSLLLCLHTLRADTAVGENVR